MEHIHIAALRPNLDALDSKQLKAVVTLIWPYSSSQRQVALLLAEPDLRLRRNKGQVRARFSSSSARALATTGVGIGDEVVLSLHGAQFVQDGAVSTPGKSLDWELAYAQTVAITVRRNGTEIATVELHDAIPTPAPSSPVRKQTSAPSPLPQWSSPAFLKRARLSDGPIFEQPTYDPLADESSERHDKKRRRKSCRDWKAWTYTARTPAPDKEDAGTEDDLLEAMSSPSRPPQLPKTPVSPSRTEPQPPVVESRDDHEYVEETTIANSAEGDTTVDEGELQKVVVPSTSSPSRLKDGSERTSGYLLYDGSSEEPALDSQYDFGGDTELNTDDEGDNGYDAQTTISNAAQSPIQAEGDTVPDLETGDVTATDKATGLGHEHESADEEPGVGFKEQITEATWGSFVDAAEEHSLIDVTEAAQIEESLAETEGTTIDETIPYMADTLEAPITSSKASVDSMAISMPPPSLPVLNTDLNNTDLSVPVVDGLLALPGKQPSSPSLKAVDSATLPLPSPFPGEQAVSYMDHISVQPERALLDGPAADQDEQEPGSEADYIAENSFFSSINSSKGEGFHQDHESAFTPLRFTFGMDGAGWSRPLESSSPSPEDNHLDAVDNNLGQHVQVESAEQEAAGSLRTLPESSAPTNIDEQSNLRVATAHAADADPVPRSSNVILLSSDIESDESDKEDGAVVQLEEDQSSEEEQKVAEEVESEDGTELEVDSDEGSEEASDEESDEESGKEQGTDREPDSEADEIHPQQVLSVTSQLPENSDSGSSAGEETESQQPRSQEVTIPPSTQISAVVSEVVDFGSPSADESGDDDFNSKAASVEPVQVDSITRDPMAQEGSASSHNLQPENHAFDTRTEVIPMSTFTDSYNFDDFIGMDVVQDPTAALSSSPIRHIRDAISNTIEDTHDELPDLAIDDWEPQLGMDDPLPTSEDLEPPATQADLTHSDVKMESVEDDSSYLMSQPAQDTPYGSGTNPESGLLIEVPEAGHKIGELQFKAVPDTAPARNTRSKAKIVASPSEDDVYVSRLSTSMRSTRSKASLGFADTATVSPPQTRTRTRSTVTPTRDATQTSPYSLRSRSKHLSPNKSPVVSQPASIRRSPRKLSRRDTDFDIVPSQLESRELFGSMFAPSQELGFGYSQTSQSRYSDVGFVKDSEEDTSRSEASMSTIQDSDDDHMQPYTDLSNLVHPVEGNPTSPGLKPPPASLSTPQHQTDGRSQSSVNSGMIVSPNHPPQSPRRSPRLARSTFSASPSPRIIGPAISQARASSPMVTVVDKDLHDEVISKNDRVTDAYPAFTDESTLQSSPSEIKNVTRLSPTAHNANTRESDEQASGSISSDVTQTTAIDPLLSFQARQPEESLLTPQLTQTTATSASLRSFDIPLPGVQTQPAPRRAPLQRRDVIADTSSSPVHQSPDAVSASDEDQTLVTRAELPSIGLSTPLAYYTPLRDLIYFINRSSQFHSASNPDTLALCISSSTSPVRAAKGPRHWTTTLHITDLSTYPSTTTVNIFRAYQNALPVAEAGDVVLLRAFAVESRKRAPVLRSADESSWCVWRYGKPVWGAKKGKWGQLRAREEVKGPSVERGEGEWTEVEKLRGWWVGTVKEAVECQEEGKVEEKEASTQDEVKV